MAMRADENGNLTGQFTIPENVQAGTKPVEFFGANESYGLTSFTGTQSLVTVSQRQTDWRVISNPPPPPPAPAPSTSGFVHPSTLWSAETRARVMARFADPLAQTFTPGQGFWCGGVDLWVDHVGTSAIEVQLRTTNVGIPTQVIRARARLSPSQIQDGAINRWEWAPTYLNAGVELAVVVMCDDATGAVGIARMGEQDIETEVWCAAQPYAVGVMLSSSNASTWSPLQNEDLWFALQKCVFSPASREVDLGSVSVTDATDFMVLAQAEIIGGAAAYDFLLTLPDGSEHVVEALEPLVTATPQTGDVQLVARLFGGVDQTPVVLPNVQLSHGKTSSNGVYTSRVVPAGAGSVVTIYLESLTPGSSSVAVHCQASVDHDTWLSVPVISGTPVGNGWEEITHRLSGYDGEDVRVRLTISGSATARAMVRNLRVVVT